MAASTINADILYKTYNVAISAYGAGTVGTRAAYQDMAIGISGYIPVSATVGAVLAGYNYRVDVGITNDNLRCLVYYAQPQASSAFTVPVRVMYIKSGT